LRPLGTPALALAQQNLFERQTGFAHHYGYLQRPCSILTGITAVNAAAFHIKI
jgi:hypothetical protein